MSTIEIPTGRHRKPVALWRKVLAAVAYDDPAAFGEIVRKAQAALA